MFFISLVEFQTQTEVIVIWNMLVRPNFRHYDYFMVPCLKTAQGKFLQV